MGVLVGVKWGELTGQAKNLLLMRQISDIRRHEVGRIFSWGTNGGIWGHPAPRRPPARGQRKRQGVNRLPGDLFSPRLLLRVYDRACGKIREFYHQHVSNATRLRLLQE